MKIDLILVSLQSTFLILYGVNGIVQSGIIRSRPYLKGELLLFTAILLGVAMASILFKDLFTRYINLLLLGLLALDYLMSVLNTSVTRWQRMLVFGTVVSLACTLQYLQWDHLGIWIGCPLIIFTVFVWTDKWSPWFTGNQTYFWKSGNLLTLFFLLEPVLQSIQQNLKPISTIPIDNIINAQNLVLLGVLILLTIGGFLWKENQDLNL